LLGAGDALAGGQRAAARTQVAAQRGAVEGGRGGHPPTLPVALARKKPAQGGLPPVFDILRHDDARETTLNPGFKWDCLDAVGLSATRRTCTPGTRCSPMVVIKGQGECLHAPSGTAEDATEV